HAVVRPLRRVDVAGTVERQEMGPAPARAGRHLAAELARPGAVPAPLAQELPLGRKDLNPMIDLVVNVHLAFLPDAAAAGGLEFAVALAGLAPLPEELAGRVVNGHAVSFLVLFGAVQVEMTDIDLARAVHRDAGRVRLDGKAGAQLAGGGEPLHAV